MISQIHMIIHDIICHANNILHNRADGWNTDRLKDCRQHGDIYKLELELRYGKFRVISPKNKIG